jgi:prepilin-type N-terminal cleavage/methylation domain-containing protein
MDAQCKKSRGMSIVELMVVIGIIGTLSSAVLIGMSTYRKKAKIARAKNDMNLYGMAIIQYNYDNKFVEPEKRWPVDSNVRTDCSIEKPFYVPANLVSNGYKGELIGGKNCSDIDYDNLPGEDGLLDSGVESPNHTIALTWYGLENKTVTNGKKGLPAKDNITLLVKGDKKTLSADSAFTGCLTEAENWVCGELNFKDK